MKKIRLACLNLALGSLAALFIFELVLHVNTGLLIRGMSLPAPLDQPVTSHTFDVRFKDGDLFNWQPELIRPVPPEQNRVEARVTFQTDDFGFPNPAPLPEKVDLVVLGRSYSMGAQAATPWTRALADQTGLSVLNLSQIGSDLTVKAGYLAKYGLPRRPRWIVVETMPSLDVIAYNPESGSLAGKLPLIVLQSLRKRVGTQAVIPSSVDPIYPLRVAIPGRTESVAFYSNYLAALTVDRRMLAASRQWAAFQAELLSLNQMAEAHGACLVVFYAPSKESIYFSLASQPDQLKPVLPSFQAWKLDRDQNLIQDAAQEADIFQMQANASAVRDALADFTTQQHVLFVDPTSALTNSALAGDPPFLVYDEHLSEKGHRLVAQEIAHLIETTPCQ